MLRIIESLFGMILNIQTIDYKELERADSVAKQKLQGTLEELSGMSGKEILAKITETTIEIALKILLAVILFYLMRWIIKRIKKMTARFLQRKKADESLQTFLMSAVSVMLNVIMIIIIIGVLGLDTTSFIALLASAGLALGMALSGTMQNFAGGVVILLLKPYKTGDFVETQGITGTVKSIQLFHTIISTTNNLRVVVPNGKLSNETITNYSKEHTRRGEWLIELDYGQDYDDARRVLEDIIKKETRILDSPEEHTIALKELGTFVVVLVRGYIKRQEFWETYWEVNRQVYKRFLEEDIAFAVPKLDLAMMNQQESQQEKSNEKKKSN